MLKAPLEEMALPVPRYERDHATHWAGLCFASGFSPDWTLHLRLTSWPLPSVPRVTVVRLAPLAPLVPLVLLVLPAPLALLARVAIVVRL